MSRIIALTQGKVTIVDDEDYEWAMQWRWYAQIGNKRTRDLWYAKRDYYGQKGRHLHVHLHREIAIRAGLPYSPRYDHRDGNGLNNRRGNIRVCTQTQNIANGRKRNGASSRFKGVSWIKKKARWRSRIQISGKAFYLGSFRNEKKARCAYAVAAQKYFGEFARA